MPEKVTDAEKLSRFLSKRLTKQRKKARAVRGGTDLFKSGVLDSFSVLELFAFLEDAFGISLKKSEMRPHAFRTTDRILAFVRAKTKKKPR